MTNIAILRRRQMRFQHSHGNYIVMTIITTIRVLDIGPIMGKYAGGKRTRCMTDTAILSSRQMIDVFANSTNAVTGSTVTYNTGMIIQCTEEGSGVMTDTTVFRGCNMTSGSSGSSPWCAR